MRRILITLGAVVVLAGLSPLRSDSQTRGIRRGDTALPDGVAAKDVRFYSEGIECHGKIFTPKGFSAEGSAPAVISFRARRGDTALPDGVAAKDVRFYSEGIECHGKIFTPKGFSAEGSAPAVISF